MQQWAKFILFDKSTPPNVTSNDQSIIFSYPCSSVIDCYPYYVVLSPGEYLFEAWGSEGGGRVQYSGKGGYSRGKVILKTLSSFFIFLGAKGNTVKNSDASTGTSFNGGGAGRTSTSSGFGGSGGGGGTDFRSSISIFSRFIVAGGGGGESYRDTTLISTAGFGGGIYGGDGMCEYNGNNYGTGANQTSPGKLYNSGSFGYGGNNTESGLTSGGGGGGWYGGGGGYGYGASGGGGSGFIFQTGCTVPNDYNIDPNISITDPLLLSGNESFLTPFGQNQIGHYGHGAAKISLIHPLSLSCVLPIPFYYSKSYILLLFNSLIIYFIL